MRRPAKWRSALRTRQRARTTLNASWFDATPTTSGVVAAHDATTRRDDDNGGAFEGCPRGGPRNRRSHWQVSGFS